MSAAPTAVEGGGRRFGSAALRRGILSAGAATAHAAALCAAGITHGAPLIVRTVKHIPCNSNNPPLLLLRCRAATSAERRREGGRGKGGGHASTTYRAHHISLHGAMYQPCGRPAIGHLALRSQPAHGQESAPFPSLCGPPRYVGIGVHLGVFLPTHSHTLSHSFTCATTHVRVLLSLVVCNGCRGWRCWLQRMVVVQLQCLQRTSTLGRLLGSSAWCVTLDSITGG